VASFVQWKYTILPEATLLGGEHSVNDDCPSFRRDLVIYLKTVGDDLEVIEIFTIVCLAEKDMPPNWFSSF